MDEETIKDVSEIRDLIAEGRKLQEKSPKFSDIVDIGDESLIENEQECHKWYTKTRSKLTKIFGEDSEQLRSFTSHFTRVFTSTNVLGTRQTERRYFYDNIGKGIAELEVLVEDFNMQEKIRNQSTINNFFDMLNLHPKVKEVSESLFKDGHYAQAIFEAFKAVNNYVKDKSGRNDLDGKSLMDQVFSFAERDGKITKKPTLQLNDLQTDTDKDEQRGFQFLFGGAMMGIRNPKAHDRVIQKDPFKTFEYLSFASLLFKRLDECKK